MFSQCFCDLCMSQGCCANIRVCWTETGHTSARSRREPRHGGTFELSAPCCNSLSSVESPNELLFFFLLFYYLKTVVFIMILLMAMRILLKSSGRQKEICTPFCQSFIFFRLEFLELLWP